MNIEGRVLGDRYEIIEKIGNGGMATVYKAKCRVLNRFVAVKILRDEFTTDDEFIKRFKIEAQAVASLTHPNIVSVYDVGNEGNLYYIVMELIQGKTLKEIISEEGTLPWKWSLNIAIQIASALETAHRNNIIHRDIKPHNIIITEEGIAKVTDFGIAKAVSNSTITAFGTTIGSVHYFSPEHARGGFTDAKSDIYSLGIVMYEMLTGRVPFDADTPVSIALKHMQEKAVEPIEVNPEVPTAVNKIIMKAMEKDVNLRYSSASEMLRDLNQALKNPEGSFVYNRGDDNGFPTQKIPIYGGKMDDIEENGKKGKKKKKPSKLKKFIKEHKALSMFIGAILLFLIVVGGTIGIMNLTTVGDVQVPNLVGLSKEEAEKQAKELKLKIEVSSEENNADIAPGYVISQDPPYYENYKIKEKTTIKIVVSKGAEIVKVPKVAGLSKEEAIAAIEKLNLKYEVTEETSQKIKEGIVIRQEPDANTDINTGSIVKIIVSKGTGIKTVSVPGVVGKSESDARSAITGAGLKVSVAYEEDSSKENGVVLKQSLDAGKSVDEGTSVTLTVNKVATSKDVTLTINVAGLTGYNSDSNTSVDETVTVEVSVDGNVVQSRQNISKKETALKFTISGKGTQTVKVNAGGSISTKQINFNETSSYTFNT